jgi:hypothetical protein
MVFANILEKRSAPGLMAEGPHEREPDPLATPRGRLLSRRTRVESRPAMRPARLTTRASR